MTYSKEQVMQLIMNRMLLENSKPGHTLSRQILKHGLGVRNVPEDRAVLMAAINTLIDIDYVANSHELDGAIVLTATGFDYINN